ncbi:MAG: hypothetical protein K6G22_15160, partial [Lachnospiraceae bacterium]|nr:hypothetical protein [Lachnospiraceae bacterium]
KLLELLNRGKGYDLYLIYLLEASMYGCNMSVPYGSWMGNTIKDAFWAPQHLTTSVQDFLYEHDECFPQTDSKGFAVLYSYGSYYWRDSNKGSGANGMQDSYGSLMDVTASEWLDPDQKPVPFWDIIRALSDINAQYDVIMLPDGEYRADDFTLGRLLRYPLVIVPDCFCITENQQRILSEYVQNGGKLLIAGRSAEGTDLAQDLEKTQNAVFVPIEGYKEDYMPGFMESFHLMYDDMAPVICEAENVGIQRYDNNGKTYIHLLNYRYDEREDRVQMIPELYLTVRDTSGDAPTVITPEGIAAPDIESRKEEGQTHIILKNVGLYAVVLI